MKKYSQNSKITQEAEVLNIEDADYDKRFLAFGEGFMDGFDGQEQNPYVPAFDYPLHSWYAKGVKVGQVYAKGRSS